MNKWHEWEFIAGNTCDTTERLRVPGGWLYRTGVGPQAVAMVFVPLKKKAKKRRNK